MRMWIEQLNAEKEVVRVRCVGGRYTHRVIPFGGRSWAAQERIDGAWRVLRSSAGRKRTFRSPEAAMRAAEASPPITAARKDGNG